MNTKNLFIYAGLLLGGLLLGFLFFGRNPEPQSLEKHIAETHTDEDGNVVYTCSMHPQIRQSEPGNCPICGMNLIKADDTGSASTDPNAVVMSKAAMELADIQTTPVVRGNPVSTLYVPGKIEPNRNKVSSVTAHVPGRIIDLYVDFEGAYVQKGEKMASLYSPQLISAQQELLETVRFKAQNPVLYQAARKKLELWELPVSTIDEIEESGKVMQSVDIVSPVSGYVTEINVNRQQHLMEGSLMYTVADLSSVWVMFDIYESQLSFVDEGQPIAFTTASHPGKQFNGVIDYIDPLLNDGSRSLNIRVKADNPNTLLKPNMLAEGVLKTDLTKEEQLLVPRSAVMWTGKRSVVFVKDQAAQEPTFSAREILLGIRVGDHYIVAEGLEAGEEVVTNGTFKLDSAAQLADKLSMMNRTPGTGANRTGHEGHTTNSENEDHSGHNLTAKELVETPSVHSHNNHLDILVEHYLVMKNALVADNFDKANTAFTAFTEEVRNNTEMNDHQEHATEHQNHHGMMLSAVASAESSETLESFRDAFVKISKELLTALENQNYQHPSLFVQFCPMANDGEGAKWISDEEKIANPFYGQTMHNCGETVAKIDF